jgi:hypothetical protein
MCGPALGLIGGLVSAVGSIASGAAQQSAANAQASAYERQAYNERQAALYNASRQREKAVELIAQQRVGFLDTGISLMGTPMNILEDTTTETEMDVAAIKYNGEIKAQNFEMQADIYRMKGENAMMGGLIGSIAPVIKGFGGTPDTASPFAPTFGGSNLETV